MTDKIKHVSCCRDRNYSRKKYLKGKGHWPVQQYLHCQNQWECYSRKANIFHVVFYNSDDWQILMPFSNEEEKISVAAVKMFLRTTFWHHSISKHTPSLPQKTTEKHEANFCADLHHETLEGTGSWWTVRSPWLLVCHLCRGSGCNLRRVI